MLASFSTGKSAVPLRGTGGSRLSSKRTPFLLSAPTEKKIRPELEDGKCFGVDCYGFIIDVLESKSQHCSLGSRRSAT